MGSCFSSSTCPQPSLNLPEIHIKTFTRTYRFLRLPKAISFIHDSNMVRIQHRSTKKLYILKRVFFSHERDLYFFLTKLDQIIEFQHPNLLDIIHYAIEKPQLEEDKPFFTVNIVLENFSHTLQDELLAKAELNEQFKERRIKSILNGVVEAMEFLQLKNITYGDLRPNRIYITPNKQPKLLYLGNLPPPIDTSFNTNNSVSPQARNFDTRAFLSSFIGSINQAGTNPYKGDVFSLGLIIIDMMLQTGWNELSEDRKRNIEAKLREMHTSRSFGPYLVNSVQIMLKRDELARPDFLELKKILLVEEYMEFAMLGQIREMVEDLSEICYQKTSSNSNLQTSNSLISNDTVDGCSGSEDIREETIDLGRRLDFQVLENERVSAKGAGKSSERLIEGNEEKGDESTLNFEEMTVQSEKDLQVARDNKIATLRKLVVKLGGGELGQENISVLSQIIRENSLLDELVLLLPDSKLGDNGLKMICEGMASPVQLSLCCINLKKAWVTNVGMKALAECLGRKQNLVKVAISVPSNHISEEGCHKIAQCLTRLRNLRSLALNLGGNKLGNRGLAAVGRELGKMMGIENLNVFLYDNQIKGKEGLLVLFDGLKRIKKLRKLEVNLMNNLLEDKELEVMRKFAEESSVEVLTIDLRENYFSKEGKMKARGESLGKEGVNIQL